MESIGNYGILGYGIDIIHNQALKPVFKFTYEKQQTFEFQKKILIPDQFRFDPTPLHKMTDQRVSSVMQSAREFQHTLSTERGMGGRVEGVEFSGEASTVNSLFKSESSKKVREYLSICSEYVILGLDGVLLHQSVLPEVVDAAQAVLNGTGNFSDFFSEFGTHIVKKASIGGQLKVNTDLLLDSSSSKKMSQTGVSVSAEAKQEAVGFVKGKTSFDTRSSSIDSTYHQSSNVVVTLTGGNIAAKNFDEWRDSLTESEIFTCKPETSPMLQLGQPSYESTGNTYLGLVNPQYVPLHTALNLNEAQIATFDEALTNYLGGVNPFEDKVQRLDPVVPEAKEIKLGNTKHFKMRGWMATYETYAGLLARPGAYAIVKCKSDAESGGWTEKTVYAGETVKLRGKKPYMSGRMDVKFISLHGDSGGDVKVYARNKLVSW